MWYRIILNKVGSCAQKFDEYNKTFIEGRITSYIYSYINKYAVTDKAHLIV